MHWHMRAKGGHRILNACLQSKAGRGSYGTTISSARGTWKRSMIIPSRTKPQKACKTCWHRRAFKASKQQIVSSVRSLCILCSSETAFLAHRITSVCTHEPQCFPQVNTVSRHLSLLLLGICKDLGDPRMQRAQIPGRRVSALKAQSLGLTRGAAPFKHGTGVTKTSKWREVQVRKWRKLANQGRRRMLL